MKKTVVVTGASGGIGREIARVLSDEYLVLAQYNSHPEELEKPVEEAVDFE